MTNPTVAQHLYRSIKGNRLLTILAIAVLLTGIPVLFVAAIAGEPIVFGVALLLAYLCEEYTKTRAVAVLNFLGTGHINMALRFVLRDAAAILLLSRSADLPTLTLVAIVCGYSAIHVLRFGASMAAEFITNRRKPVYLTRNIDLSELDLPDAPRRFLRRSSGRRRLLHLTALANIGAAVDVITGSWYYAAAGTAIGVVIGIGLLIPLSVHARRVKPLADRDRYKQAVLDQIEDYAPEVVLYFSHEPRVKDSAYQVNMWLSTLEKLRQRFVVLVREPAHVERISPTNAPIVCIPGGADVVNFDIPSLRLALYPGNTGKNIHLLRNNAIKHVFVGHGDSDKASSANPFCTVYDQVWTAGKAGRDRFHRANAGVADDRMVEVGRPQLDAIGRRQVRRSDMFTVLYAPTWEGWSNDMLVSSLQNMGTRLVSILLDLDMPVRVIYKPHPLTGIRDKEIGAINAQIRETLLDANRSRAALPGFAGTADPAAQTAATARLAELTAQISGLKRPTDPADALERARDNGTPDHASTTLLTQLTAEIADTYWRQEPDWHHRVVKGANPHLYDCFEQADLLISDVSSVVSDFIATGKPYIICNPSDIDESRFRADNTAAGGAYILGDDCEGLTRIVAGARSGAPDPMADARDITRKYLLGPDSPSAQVRFAAAVDSIIGASSPPIPHPAAGTDAAFNEAIGAGE